MPLTSTEGQLYAKIIAGLDAIAAAGHDESWDAVVRDELVAAINEDSYVFEVSTDKLLERAVALEYEQGRLRGGWE